MTHRKLSSVLCAILLAMLCPTVQVGAEDFPTQDNPYSVPFADIPLYEQAPGGKPESAPTAEKPSEPLATTQNEKAEKNEKSKETEDVHVEDLGDPKQLQFDGVSLFSAHQLQCALSFDVKYQVAARPTNQLASFLRTIEDRLREGYANSGCPDAKVAARHNTKREAIVVRVEEGPQYRNGQIRVYGTQVIDEQILAKWLATYQSPRLWGYKIDENWLDPFAEQDEKKAPNYGSERDNRTDEEVDGQIFWEANQIHSFRPSDEARLSAAVRLALIELGYANCRFQLLYERHPLDGVVDLRIAIRDDVPHTTIGDINITGLKRDSRDELLKYLQVSTGDPLDGALILRINDRLADSCRYWQHRPTIIVHPDYPLGPKTDGTKATLRLALEEYEPAAPLSKPLEPTDEIMRKCAAWINLLATNFGDKDIVCSSESVNVGGGLQQSRLALAADGTLAVHGLLTTTAGWRANHDLVIRRQGLDLYDWQSHQKLCLPNGGRPTFRFRVRADHDENNAQVCSITVGYAWSNKNAQTSAELLSDIRVSPAALVRVARLPESKVEVHDGVLTLKSNELELRIDVDTGAVRSVQAAAFLAAGVSTVAIERKAGIAKEMVGRANRLGGEFPNRFDQSNPIGSSLGFVVQQLGRQPIVQSNPSWSQLCKLGEHVLADKEFETMIENWREDFRTDSHNSEFTDFSIPQADRFETHDWLRQVGYCVPWMADRLFPRGSWPWTFSREEVFSHDFLAVESEENVRPGHEFVHALKRMDYGPVGELFMSKAFEFTGTETLHANLAKKALQDLSDPNFVRDTKMLCDGDHGLAVICRAIVQACGELPDDDLQAIGEYMPAEAHNTLKRLVARRKSKPDEAAGDAIEAVMLDWWHDDLKDTVESELRAMSTNVARAPDSEETTK